MDHIEQAVYSTVHSSEIGTKRVAELMGMSHQILINKTNPQNEHNKLSLLEAVHLQRITEDFRIAEAMCLELGVNVLAPLHHRPNTLMDAMLTVVSECGDVSKKLKEVLEDGKLTDREKEEMQREINEAVDSLIAMRLVIKDYR